MNETYKKQVALLIRIMPLVYKISDFAVHGGTAINLFVKNMPRYSVDVDLTFLPIKNREESITTINNQLNTLKQQIEKAIPGIRVIHKSAVLKLQCTYGGATVKIEVNGIKRGIIGEVEEKEFCEKAQKEFKMSCVARVVPFSLLYGGKIAAALGRQHPRDLFDFKYMEIESFDYADFEAARTDLIEKINQNITNIDREFILSFETGNPDWEKCCAGDLSSFPAIQWKLKNIQSLKETNPSKFNEGIEKLRQFLF